MLDIQYNADTCQLIGQLTQENVIALWACKQDVLKPNMGYMDLSLLTFCDTAGLAFLLTLWQDSQATGMPVQIVNPSKQVNHLIELYGLQNGFVMQTT